MKKFFSMLLACALAVSLTACPKDDEPTKTDPDPDPVVQPENPETPDTPETPETPTEDPVVLAPAESLPPLGIGWNLGNHFDAHNDGVASETAWGNPTASPMLFNRLKADGFTSVRIPVTWLGHIGAAPDYKLDAKYLTRVEEVVDYAQFAGLNVIINIHHDGSDSKYWLNIKEAAASDEANTRIKEELAAVWTQIAERFKNKGDFLVFESFNEIHDGGWGWGDNLKDGGKQYAIVNEWNQVFVDAVRATGGKNATRYLGVAGYCANPDLTMANLVLPNDPANRLMVAVHTYDPMEFCLTDKYSQWGHTAQAGKKETWGDEQHIRDLFAKVKKAYVDKGIPVYFGETGCVHRSTDLSESFRKYYLEYVARVARDAGIAMFIWDNGAKGAGNECHGYYTHDNGEYINNSGDVVKCIIRGYRNDADGYSLQSIWDSAPKP